eukprot:5026534-Amphidinium_carterae.1
MSAFKTSAVEREPCMVGAQLSSYFSLQDLRLDKKEQPIYCYLKAERALHSVSLCCSRLNGSPIKKRLCHKNIKLQAFHLHRGKAQGYLKALLWLHTTQDTKYGGNLACDSVCFSTRSLTSVLMNCTTAAAPHLP